MWYCVFVAAAVSRRQSSAACLVAVFTNGFLPRFGGGGEGGWGGVKIGYGTVQDSYL